MDYMPLGKMSKPLATSLIKHYEETIVIINGIDDLNSIKKILRERYVNAGICNCAMRLYSIIIYGDYWVKNFSANFDNFWFRQPIEFDNKVEIIDALQSRVDRLKTYK